MEDFSNRTDNALIMPDPAAAAAPEDVLPPVYGEAIEYEAGAREFAHRHAHAQLLYATSGLIRVRTPAASWVVTPDCAMLVPPFVEHELEMVGKVGFRTLYLDPCPLNAADEGRLLPVGGLLREAILALVKEPARTRAPGSLADILTQLIVKLLAAATPADEPPGRLPLPQHPRLHRICQALIEEPANSDSLEHWGDRFGASSRTLARHFQRETGMPFAKWREEMRVSEAMCLLSTHTPIDEVARYLGYADASSFAVMFKRVLHMTPVKYQSMMRSGVVEA
ncbi:helix-turn-helix transcriptional regulator [Paraburkholderia sp. Ac-20340]|uniref:AraC family transcriptional regulator n=1 Tax=Paraburkholderia sp. Ac-20340 TaxID=2703888 RepID=UPI0019816219|nr:helix-turn-helix transcriptional regulator [Paraburkholderia sp. Ac-20340]MBN3858678.1 helix-turn-helix transcriptional regulator [Paraburkholderia sp. Ac-20340]